MKLRTQQRGPCQLGGCVVCAVSIGGVGGGCPWQGSVHGRIKNVDLDLDLDIYKSSQIHVRPAECDYTSELFSCWIDRQIHFSSRTIWIMDRAKIESAHSICPWTTGNRKQRPRSGSRLCGKLIWVYLNKWKVTENFHKAFPSFFLKTLQRSKLNKSHDTDGVA